MRFKKSLMCWVWWCILLFPCTRVVEAEESEFKASLLYIVSPRSPRFTQKDPVSKKKTLTKLLTL